MATHSKEVMDGEVLKSINRKLKKLSDDYTYTALPTLVMTKAMKELDPASFTVWLQLYIQSYFKDGEVTTQLRELAKSTGLSKSTIELKIKTLIEKGYLYRRHNLDTTKKFETFLASTFYVIIPEHIFEEIKQAKTRSQCYKEAGQLLVGEGYNKGEIKADVEAITEKVVSDEITELKAVKNELEATIQEMESSSKSDMQSNMVLLQKRIRLKNINEEISKKFASQETHNPSQKSGGGSPENREYNKTNNSLDCLNNNNRPVNKPPRHADHNHDKLSTNCSFASHDKTKETGYLNQPVTLNEGMISKIKKAISSATVSNPEEVYQEAVFAISRRFTDKSVVHAFNVFVKLLREGRWTTPLPMRSKSSVDCEKPAVRERSPKVTAGGHFSGYF